MAQMASVITMARVTAVFCTALMALMTDMAFMTPMAAASGTMRAMGPMRAMRSVPCENL